MGSDHKESTSRDPTPKTRSRRLTATSASEALNVSDDSTPVISPRRSGSHTSSSSSSEQYTRVSKDTWQHVLSLLSQLEKQGYGAGYRSDVTVDTLGERFRVHWVVVERFEVFRTLYNNNPEAPLAFYDFRSKEVTKEAIDFAFRWMYNPSIDIPAELANGSLAAVCHEWGLEELAVQLTKQLDPNVTARGSRRDLTPIASKKLSKSRRGTATPSNKPIPSSASRELLGRFRSVSTSPLPKKKAPPPRPPRDAPPSPSLVRPASTGDTINLSSPDQEFREWLIEGQAAEYLREITTLNKRVAEEEQTKRTRRKTAPVKNVLRRRSLSMIRKSVVTKEALAQSAQAAENAEKLRHQQEVAAAEAEAEARIKAANDEAEAPISAVTRPLMSQTSKRFSSSIAKEYAGATKQERMYMATVDEILNTERDYVADLQRMITIFIDPFKKSGLIDANTITSLFSNVTVLQTVNSELLELLEVEEKKKPEEQNFGSVFLKMADYLKMYSNYIVNSNRALEVLDKIRKNPAVNSFLEKQVHHPEAQLQPIDSFLIKPLQRITKYPLLLRELKKHMMAEQLGIDDLDKAMEKMQSVAKTVNEHKRLSEKQKELLAVQDLLVWGDDVEPVQLFTPTRNLIRQGDCRFALAEGKFKLVPKHIFLFTDLLILSGPIKNKKYVVDLVLESKTLMARKEPVPGKVKSEGFALISTDVKRGYEKFYIVFDTKDDSESWLVSFTG